MTTESKKQTDASGSSRTSTVALMLTVLAAFLAALTFRQSVGILAMTPVAFIIIAAATAIDLRPLIKNTIFVLMIFIVNTIEQEDIIIPIIFSALCLLVRIVSDVTVKVIKKNKKLGILSAAAGSALCIFLSLIFVGNPITAIIADGTIDEYTLEKYPQNDSAALGSFSFSDIYYNFRTGAYAVDAVSSEYPTESAMISAENDIIRDRFETVMTEKIAEPYVLELTSVLREAFPDESFGVAYDRITSLPDDAVLSKAAHELDGAIIFEISLGGVQTAPQMIKKVKKYIKAIDEADFEYAEIIFKSGTGSWIRRSVSVSSNRLKSEWTPKINYVPAGTSNSFNEFLFNDSSF